MACEIRGRGEVYPGLDAGYSGHSGQSHRGWWEHSAPPDPEAFRVMGAVSEHLSTEILEEVADLLDCGP